MATELSGGETGTERPFGIKRTRYWVLPKLQGRVIAWVVLGSAVVGTTIAWAILLVLWSSLGGQLEFRGGALDADALFKEAMIRVFATTGLLVLVFALVSLVSGLVLSHRVAGPLHRISLVGALFAQGQYRERVKLRRNDYLQEFATKFNGVLDQVEGRMREHQSLLSGTYARLTELQLACASGSMSSEEMEKRLLEIMKVIRQARLNELVEDTPGS